MATLMDLDLSAFVNVTVKWFVRFIRTIGNFIAYQRVIDALTIGACELSRCTCAVLFLGATDFIGTIATIVFAVATILISNAFKVLAGKLLR